MQVPEPDEPSGPLLMAARAPEEWTISTSFAAGGRAAAQRSLGSASSAFRQPQLQLQQQPDGGSNHPGSSGPRSSPPPPFNQQQQEGMSRQRSGTSGSSLAGVGGVTSASVPHPRVIYCTYKYMWATGDRQRSLNRLEGFTSMLQGRLTR